MIILGSSSWRSPPPEPVMGRLRTLVFFLLCGAAAVGGSFAATVLWERVIV